MAWYQLTADVMVQGTPRSFGEVLDLSVTDGQLLIGLGRAKPVEAKPAEDPPIEAVEPACPMPAAPVEAEAKPVEAKAQVKPVARRRTPSPTPED
jgi:hypothetical protein